MSYMSLLQEHANQLGNHITNNEELQNVAASQKAQSLADKYNEVQEHYNAGVGAISTLSSALHMGRKVYKGLQKARLSKSTPSLPPPPGRRGSTLRRYVAARPCSVCMCACVNVSPPPSRCLAGKRPYVPEG